MHETSDALRANGLLTLGSRLRRLGERLQSDAQAILDGLEPRVASALHPTLELLDREGPRPIGLLAEGLGVTQPGVTRAVAALSALGLVEVAADPEDGRVRRAGLTAEGRAFVATARATAWRDVEAAVADLCAGFAAELLDDLAKLEEGLADRPLQARVPRDRVRNRGRTG